MPTLLALHRRPDGAPDALEAFERRYTEEHLPLVSRTPGLRRVHGERVVGAVDGETDIALVTTLEFEDRDALDAALRSEEFAAARRNLQEISPTAISLLILEDAPDVVPETGG